MAELIFEGVGIRAIAAAVPDRIINNYEYTENFPKEDVKQVIDKIGVFQRRFADKKTCSSDLCYAAAEKLFTETGISREEVDLLVFISQTPDYRMPATSVLLQNRLGLSQGTITFDLNLGCSGYIFGLSMVYSMMERSNLKKALVLDGETRSRVYSQKDRKTAFLFGDAGSASIIERNEAFGKSYFSLNSDGSKEDLIKMKAGGYRYPSSQETLKEKVVDEHGNIRSDEHGYMNGADVFNFVIGKVPKDIKKVMSMANVESSDIKYFVLHQANSFINSYLIKKLKLESERVPVTVDKYGNTSSVSIPLTIVSELKNKLDDSRLLLSGFGVGMTWASCVLNMSNCHVCEIVEYQQ